MKTKKHFFGMTLFAIIALVAIIGISSAYSDDDNKPWVNPATQKAKLIGGTKLLSYTEAKSIKLSGSPYEYETWDYSWDTSNSSGQNGKGENKFTWYGENQGGGGAFKAEWQKYFQARLGFFWGNGGNYTQYKNIYTDYNFKRSDNASTWGGFIGIYGWFRSPSASNPNEQLIEYYIVDDWFFNAQLGLAPPFKSELLPLSHGIKYGEELGSFQVDGAVYKIYKNLRIDEASIDWEITDGKATYTQIFSVRQGRRTNGTISVTEHFNAWSKYFKLEDIYEVKFLVEVFGGKGYLDLTYLYLSQETNRRNWIPAGTPPVDYVPPAKKPTK